MTTLFSTRYIVDAERQIVGKAQDSDAAAALLGGPAKLRNIEWQTGEHGFQCPFVEQVWMPAFSDLDSDVCQDLSAALFADDVS